MRYPSWKKKITLSEYFLRVSRLSAVFSHDHVINWSITWASIICQLVAAVSRVSVFDPSQKIKGKRS
jgi:hypothetical protein